MNRIEAQADEFQKLLETIQQHRAKREEQESCPYCAIRGCEGHDLEQREAEKLDALRLADLERNSNV